MDLFSDMISALQSDLTVGNESSLFDPTVTIPLALNRAHRKIGNSHLWPMLDDSQKTSAIAGQEDYDYPQGWLPNSIWKLRVDGVTYGDDEQPMNFRDYLHEVENKFPSGNTKIWANQQLRYFIQPIPTATGNNNIELWGSKSVGKLVNPNDTTIFSYSMPEVNEAILLEAAAILRTKTGDEPVMLVRYFEGTYLLSLEANQIVEKAWHKIKQADSQKQKTMPFFDVPDFFRPGNAVNKKIGDF